MRSRSRSACPLWRAYSSIMCTSSSRSETGSPSESRPTKPRSWSRVNCSAKAISSCHAVHATSTAAGSATAPVKSASGSASVWYRLGTSSPANRRRNQPRSTSAMCRTRPSRDIVEGSTARRASCPASSPSHFSCSVSRWQRRNSLSVVRSSPSRGPPSRGSEPGSRNRSARCCGVVTPTQATTGEPAAAPAAAIREFVLEFVDGTRAIPPGLWRGELGYLAAISPAVHRLVLQLTDRLAAALATAISDTSAVPPPLARLQGIALAGCSRAATPA